MSEQKPVATQEDLELAVKVISQWHQQNGLSWAIVNSGSGIIAIGGNSLELESSLNHAHKIIESENGMKFYEIYNMKNHPQGNKNNDDQ